MRPVLFEIPIPFSDKVVPLFAYGAMVALAALTGILLGMRRARDAGLTPERIMDLGLYSVVAGVLGARAFHILENLAEYGATKPKFVNPLTQEKVFRAWYEVLFIWEGGLVFYGGFIGAVLYFLYFFRRNRMTSSQVVNMLDVGAVCMPVGLALGRMGCWFNGCCYGKVCELAWAVRFPGVSADFLEGSHLFQAQLAKGIIAPDASDPAWAHPTQMYSWAVALLLFLLLNFLYKRRSFPGQITGLWITLYAVARFALELLRLDNVPYFFGWMTISQTVSIFAFVIGVTLLALFWRAHRRRTAAAERPATPAT